MRTLTRRHRRVVTKWLPDSAKYSSYFIGIDSDNNGYINTNKNTDRMLAEDKMEGSTAKPITYFPGHLQNIPDDYKHVPLRVTAALGNATHFSFHYTDNIAVYRVSKGF